MRYLWEKKGYVRENIEDGRSNICNVQLLVPEKLEEGFYVIGLLEEGEKCVGKVCEEIEDKSEVKEWIFLPYIGNQGEWWYVGRIRENEDLNSKPNAEEVRKRIEKIKSSISGDPERVFNGRFNWWKKILGDF